jgi:cell division protein FtsQ
VKVKKLQADARFDRENWVETNNRFKAFKSGIKLLLIIVLFITVLILLSVSPLFNIVSIDVKGSGRYEADTLINIAGIHKGMNGFKAMGPELTDIIRLRFGTAERNILKSCPYLKSVAVKYVLPGRVEIVTIERKPAGIVPYLGTSLLIDSEGYVLDTAEEVKGDGLPLIRGITIDGYELGCPLEPQNPETVLRFIEVMDTLQEEDKTDGKKIAELVETIDVSDSSKVCLFIDSRIVVNLGNLHDLNYKIELMKEIYYKNIKENEKGFLDLSYPEKSVFTPEG